MAEAKKYRAPKLRALADGTEKKDEKKKPDPYHYDPRPDITLTAEELPALEKWEVGKKYKLTIEVEMKSLHAGENGKENSGRFKVLAVGTKKD